MLVEKKVTRRFTKTGKTCDCSFSFKVKYWDPKGDVVNKLFLRKTKNVPITDKERAEMNSINTLMQYVKRGYYVCKINLEHCDCTDILLGVRLDDNEQTQMENYVYEQFLTHNMRYLSICSTVFKKYNVRKTRGQIKNIIQRISFQNKDPSQ